MAYFELFAMRVHAFRDPVDGDAILLGDVSREGGS